MWFENIENSFAKVISYKKPTYTPSKKLKLKNKLLLIDEIIASVFSIIATILLALFGQSDLIRLIVFMMYTVSNVLLIVFCYYKQLKFLMISQIVFFITSLIGIVSNLIIILK